MKKSFNAGVLTGIILLVLSFSLPPLRWDLTADKRYTLNEATIKIIRAVPAQAEITVYLAGEFPSYFKKLQYETAGLLDEFHRINPKIQFHFTNPGEKGEKFITRLLQKGMQPAEITVRKGNKLSQIRIFPWAEIRYRDTSAVVPLMVNTPGLPVEEQINRSIENLEYAFAYHLRKLTRPRKPAVAVLKGNGEWPDIFIADFLMALRDFYRLAPFTLDSLETSPERTIRELQKFDMILIAGPTEKFSRLDKFAIDQFLMNGGSMMLLFDPVKAHKDTLLYHSRTYALNAELDLEDLLFFYGVRPKPILVKDLVAAPIALKVGDIQGNPQLLEFPWVYSPVVKPSDRHPVGKNTGQVKLDFASVLDTLKNPLKKTLILRSSPYTDLQGVPAEINFEDIARKPDKSKYTKGRQTLGVLVEGKFRSAFKGRVKPVEIPFKDSAETKILVVADADIIKNDLDQGQPLPLGLDKWTGIQYDNKTFLLNAAQYLTDKEGLYLLKNKIIRLALIDKNKAVSEDRFWRLFNLAMPLALLIFLFGTAIWWRTHKYRRYYVDLS